MPVVWHPYIWWDWCMLEDEKKEIDPMFTEGFWKCVSVVYKLGVLKHFTSWGIESYFELYQVFMLNQATFIQKCFNTLRPKYDPGGKICPQGA